MENSIKKPNMLEVAARLNAIDKSIQEGHMDFESLKPLLSSNFSKNTDYLKLINGLIAENFDFIKTAANIHENVSKTSRKKLKKEFDKLIDEDNESLLVEITLFSMVSVIMSFTRMPKPATQLSFKSISILLGMFDEMNEKKLIKKYGNELYYALYEILILIYTGLNSRGNVKHVNFAFEIEDSLIKKLFGLKDDSYKVDNSNYSIYKSYELKQVFLDFVLIMNGLTQPKNSKVYSRYLKKYAIASFGKEFKEDIDNYFDNSNEIKYLEEIAKNTEMESFMTQKINNQKSTNSNQFDYFEIFRDFCNETLDNVIDLKNLISTAQSHGINRRIDYLLERPKEKDKKNENAVLASLYLIDPLLKTLDFMSDYIKARLSYEAKLQALNLGNDELTISTKDLSILAFTSERTIKNELWREDSLLYIKKNNVRPIKSNIKSEPANSVDFLSFQDAYLWLNDEKRKIPFNNLIDCTEVIGDFIDSDFFRDLKQKKL